MTYALRKGLTYEETREKVVSLICDNARVRPQELSMSKHLRGDLHLDSLDFLSVLSAIEGEFGVVISDDEAGGFETVADACELLWEKLA